MIFTKNNAKFSFIITNYLGLKPEATNISLLPELYVHIPESPCIIIKRSFLFACLYIKFSLYFTEKLQQIQCSLIQTPGLILRQAQERNSGLIYCTLLRSFNAIGMISCSSPRFQSRVSCRKNMSAVGTDHIQKSMPYLILTRQQ